MAGTTMSPKLLLLAVISVLVLGLQDSRITRPTILVKDGHLLFLSPPDKSINFTASGSGSVSFNDKDLKQLVVGGETASVISALSERMQALEQQTRGPSDDWDERVVTPSDSSSATSVQDVRQQLDQLLGSGPSRLSPRVVRRAIRRIMSLETRVSRLTRLLTLDECQTRTPCRNGGTCTDLFNGFVCKCPPGFTGTTCESDVNECQEFAGTDSGCRNGGTCRNTHGSYSCLCPSSYFGMHCTERHDDCLSSSNAALCGHGTCVNVPTTSNRTIGFRCLCDEGWTKDPSTPSCSVDVDECMSAPFPCSLTPRVLCLNLPGSYVCGPCPAGFTGDGHSCHDVDECLVGNGGCSTSPLVQCVNRIGGRTCGPCPAGFSGDGVTCEFVGVCAMQNGGCHRLASCTENRAISASYRECRCPDGMIGDAVGVAGCLPAGTSGQVVAVEDGSDVCSRRPCVFGSCHQILLPDDFITSGNNSSSASFVCRCFPGFSGSRCEVRDESVRNECSFSTPCRNGGTCVPWTSPSGDSGFSCRCTDEWTGATCEQGRSSCGGILSSLTGILDFPMGRDVQSSASLTYRTNADCVWVIQTRQEFVLSLNISSLNIGSDTDCLSFYDGADHSFPLRLKLCSSQIPDSPINSTHNSMYIWFHSDSESRASSFSLTWNSTSPSCGSSLAPADFGSISSPGYPGNYPHSRDCYWMIRVPIGKRMIISFASLGIETHSECGFDFVKLYDGEREWDPLLKLLCNSTLPSPVTSSSSSVLMHFHSDDSLSDKGFHVTYSAVPGIPGCGGLMTQDRGFISSPNFATIDGYPNSVECDWLIRVHPNDRISFRFTVFDLEDHSKCSFDHLELFDGPDESSPLIGRFCGRNTPPERTSSAHTVRVRFRADASFAGRGFQMQYKTSCGGLFESESGLIMSPFFPDRYPSDRECKYHIRVPMNHIIVFQFLDFDLEPRVRPESECQFDYVEVTDTEPRGNDTKVQSYGRFCGSGIPGPVFSRFNELHVVFRTDGSENNRGFRANFSSIDVACGGVLSSTTGTFSPPSLTATRTGDMVILCNWLISAPTGFIVRLNFPLFSLESTTNCTNEYIAVYDSDDRQLGSRLCGNVAPSSIQSSGSQMVVSYRMPMARPADTFTGSYIVLNASSTCGGNLFSDTGIIRTPNFPDFYPSSRDCVWVVNADAGKQIRLMIKFFDMENTPVCDYDFLEIRNGGDMTSPIVGRFCGSSFPPKELISHSNQLFLRFKSDQSVSGKGFELMYDSGSSGCGGSLTSPTGGIQSPNYPSPYAHNADCFWLIRVSKGSVIVLVVQDIEIEDVMDCAYDNLQIFDGASDESRSLGRICSSAATHAQFKSSSNVMSLRFRSDASQNGRGFKISYSTNCTNTVSGSSGVIESPNYPNAYPKSLNCSWRIVAPAGNNISIAFSDLHLEESNDCLFDSLQVLEVSPVTAELKSLRKFCGRRDRLPPPFNTSSETAIVNFVTDATQTAPGFRMEWRAVGCGYDFVDKTTGSIVSPNYPHGYPQHTECLWTITVPADRSVELWFSDFDLESSFDATCPYDRVEIRAGSPPSETELYRFCHKLGSDVVSGALATSANRVTVYFKSDGSIVGKGFNIRFRTRPSSCGGRILNLEQHYITSPNYPNAYQVPTTGLLTCVYSIEAQANHRLEVRIEDLSLPQTTNCTKNSLSLFDGQMRGRSVSPVFRLCSMPTTLVYQTKGSRATIGFSASQSGKGFKVMVKTVCGAILQAKNRPQYFSSPNFPHRSVIMQTCNWTITAREAEDKVLLSFPTIFSSAALQSDGTCDPESQLVIRDGDQFDSPVLKRLCTSHSPRPIVSSGRSLVVQMSWNFVFKAMYTTATSSCGDTMTLTASSGVILSPGYPIAYPLDTQCVWGIKAPAGNRISLSFGDFRLEESEFCNEDYVEVREDDAVFAGRWCGTQTPVLATNLSSSSRMSVKFRSDGEGSAPGFELMYRLVHGVQLSGTEGRIESPGYPIGILDPNDLSYTWSINTPPGTVVRVSFRELEIRGHPPECFSGVRIMDGEARTGSLLGSFCGYAPPEPVIATSSLVTVVFSPAGLSNGKFVIQWQAVDPPMDRTSGSRNTSIGTMSKMRILPNVTLNLQSPGYPFTYPNDYNHSWILETIPGFHFVLNVTDILLEGQSPCYYDKVMIHEKTESTDWRLNRTICGALSSLTQKVFETSSHLSMITFVTDSSSTYNGFQIRVTVACGGLVTAYTGVITSDFAPLHSTCDWRVTVRDGRTIRLTFEYFDIQSSQSSGSCSESYLMVRNGGSSASPFLGSGRFCGQSLPSVPESTSNNLFVRFVSNPVLMSSVPKFRVRYEEISTACGGRLFLSNDLKSIELKSPNYPQVAPHDLFCDWIISGPEDSSLRIDFDHTTTSSSSCNASYEYVEVRDGGSLVSQPLKQVCVPVPMTTESVKSSGHMMFVRFVTSGSPVSTFRAVVSIDVCGGTFYVPSYRVIEGPFASGHNYSNNMDCRYVIRTRAQYTMIFGPAFTGTSDMPSSRSDCSNGDYLELRNTDPIDGSIIGRFCNNMTVSGESEGSVVHMTFHSDFMTTGRGFRFSVRVNYSPCGKDIDPRTDGEITSPNFPNAFPHHRECVWRIPVPPAKQLVIEFLYWNMKASARDANECLDSLLVKRKLLRDVVTRINCSTSQPPPVVVMGMTEMHFRTKGLSGNEGFRLRYSLTDAECGGLLTGTSGILTPVGFADSSMINQRIECSWLFDQETTPPSVQQTLGAVFEVFEVPYPRISPYRGACLSGVFATGQSNGMILDDMCGNQTGRGFYVVLMPPASGSFFYLLMNYTDEYRGISGRYSVQACGGDYVQAIGVNITSPGYPDAYPPNTLCSWTFRSEVGGVIELTFTDLDMESDAGCAHDFVDMMAGDWTSAPRIGRYCGSPSLPLVVEHRSYLLLTMRTDDTGVGKGFALTVTTKETTCGGTMRFPFASSPHFQQSDYGNNEECVWLIDEEPQFKLNISFVHPFDLEESDKCDKDFVRVEEWLHDQWIKLTDLCGHDVPQPIISRSHRARVTFRSNEAVTAAGFGLKYSTLCGSTFEQDSGLITSPNYPDAYAVNVQCEYLIVRENSIISLTFEDFVLEDSNGDCRFDFLTIFSGKRNGSQAVVRLGPYCGLDDEKGNRPPIGRPIFVQDEMLIRFTSDVSLSYRGFKARYQIFQCGGNLTASSALITSPVLPDGIDGVNCTWNITVRPNHVVGLKFDLRNFTPCPRCRSCDHILLNYGSVNNRSFTRRVCDRNWLPFNDVNKLKSWDQTMIVQLVRVPGRRSHSSFELVYRETRGTEQGCGGVIVASNASGVIQYPVSPEQEYENDLLCDWVILASREKVIRMSFDSFDLQDRTANATSCNTDYVEVRDGGRTQSPLIERLCGSWTPGTFVTTGTQTLIRFRSDAAIQKKGFRLLYQMEDKSCGGLVVATNDSQYITSPNFPAPYEPMTRCRWHFRLPSGLSSYTRFRISLNFTTLDISCANKDLIEFAFSRGVYSPTRICDATHETMARLAIPNDVWMTFQSGTGLVSRKGFRVEFRIKDCNQSFTNPNGVITNSLYPYPNRDNDMTCFIQIQAPKGRTIALYFTQMLLRSDNNRLGSSAPASCEESRMEIRSGIRLTDPVIDFRCGSSSLQPIFSTGDSLSIYVHVRTGGLNLFNILYTTTDQGPGCGGNVSAIRGSFTSPFYPSAYTGSTACRWLLMSLGHHSLDLHFPEFALSSRPGCQSNYLEVYANGQETRDKLLGRFCGQDKPADITSQGNLLVKLVVDQENAGRGFRAYFKMNELELDQADGL